ncbi:MAG TPA: leucine/isoleucine/valine transporter permease subunit, partial [Acidimicrobiia bacterium]|nr:leucine/isoleucine/valine transporter permease subunit [Acidimicrobiia bacterium]
MTATVTPAETEQRSPRFVDNTIMRVIKVGSVAGIVMVYVAAIGVLARFDQRSVIVPILSLGYLVLFAIPFMAGARFSRREQLGGVETEPRTTRDIVDAALSGLIAGLMIVIFASIIDAFPELRGTFPNLSPNMTDLATLGLGGGAGFVAMPLLSALLGAGGAAAAWIPDRVRAAVTVGGLTVLGFALTQPLVNDFFDWLRAIPNFLYTSATGLSIVSAVVLFAIGFAAKMYLPGRVPPVTAGLRSEDDAVRRRTTVWMTVAVGVALVTFPQFLGGIANELLTNVGLFALMALGLNVVVGYAGLLDLGYVAFFAVGAYSMGVLTSPISPTWDPMLTWWQAFPIVLVFAAIAGLMVGTPVLRMRGDYLAIVTLGFGEIVRLSLLSDWLSPYFGGAQGIRNIPGVPVFGANASAINPRLMIYLVMAFVLIAAFISWRVLDSRVGRAWAALREDEDVAEAVGVDTVKAKLTAFVTGAIIASFAGALFAAKVGSVFTNSFEILVS